MLCLGDFFGPRYEFHYLHEGRFTFVCLSLSEDLVRETAPNELKDKLSSGQEAAMSFLKEVSSAWFAYIAEDATNPNIAQLKYDDGFTPKLRHLLVSRGILIILYLIYIMWHLGGPGHD